MCGITGIVGRDAADLETLEAMARTIHHRGPDHMGIMREPGVALAMTRLSIIDIGGGKQPMHSVDGRYSLVFNGEIYNFRELRRELETFVGFHTNSDTEVILHGYSLWGVEIFSRLNGMFAIALWDRALKRLLLVRDPMGIKPLYYLLTSKSLWFSSELKTFTSLGLANTVNQATLSQFLCANYVFGPETAIAGVRQVEPGTILEVHEDGTTRGFTPYRLPGQKRDHHDLRGLDKAALEQLTRQQFQQAVVRQTVADVPYGLLLSSGLDSMAVLAALHRAGLTDNLHTYTVFFPESDSYSEDKPITSLAERWGFGNQLIPLRAQDLRDRWEDICFTFDNLEMLPTCAAIYFAGQIAGKERRVLLSGNGGDELLLGYPTYVATQWVRRTHVFSGILQKALPKLATWLPATDEYLGLNEKLRRFCIGYSPDSALAHARWRHVFTHDETFRLLSSEYRTAKAEAIYQPQLAHYLEGVNLGFTGASLDSWMDIRSWLVDCGLMMWDKAGMAGSTEIRVPLIDLDFVDHVLALPEDIRSGGTIGTKGLLRRIVSDELPADILALPKHGFQIPIANWLRGELREMFRDLTASLPSQVFNQAEVGRLWREFEAQQGDHGLKLWTLGALAGWSKAHRMGWD